MPSSCCSYLFAHTLMPSPCTQRGVLYLSVTFLLIVKWG